MLVNPVNLRSTNHVFSQAKHPVHPGIFANSSVICIMLDIKACFNGIFWLWNYLSYRCDLTNEGHVKSHDQGHRKSVGVVIIAVQLHGEERTDEICTLYVVVPWSKWLQPRHNFVDPFTKLHEIGVVFGCIVHSVIQTLKCRFCTMVRKIASVVWNESLRRVSSRE